MKIDVEDEDATDKDSHPQPQLERIPSVNGSGVISREKMKTSSP